VFYRQLRKKPIDLNGFTLALTALTGEPLETILAEVPPEWNNEGVQEIEHHLRMVSGHAGEFAEQIRRRLA
jgi:hypothetical protein